MWLFLNNAFVSIVAPLPNRGVDPDDFLVVRARIQGDIERLFPKAKVTSSKATDYQFRAVVSRDDVATKIAEQVVLGINYTNFKDSIPKADNKRHAAYLRVWAIMSNEYAIKSPLNVDADFDDKQGGWDWTKNRWRDETALFPTPKNGKKKKAKR